ncbi:hypothetical protein U0X36_25770 [Bacillus thuringiensis]|uniref:hypothetical protein n=1 Tax=Bacillus thuringiensis TaxID=1428 RepID=UPI000E49DA77|nr:hypothetical protein [Bacillus thuringiensis]MDZ3956222.1 hypothetical protein [Bacillus thuringiensis]RGP42393.1 hypothetical protein BTW32_30965 [Bacillus thuringiensis]
MQSQVKIGVVGVSSYFNEKLVFRVNGSFEHNDIIQRYWDKEHAHMHEDCIVAKDASLIVDTVPSNNKYGYELRLLAVWDNAQRKFFYDYDDIGMEAEYMGLVVGLEGIPEIDTSEICPHCSKGRLIPMYDEHPNWIKFCRYCDFRTDNSEYNPLPY